MAYFRTYQRIRCLSRSAQLGSSRTGRLMAFSRCCVGAILVSVASVSVPASVLAKDLRVGIQQDVSKITVGSSTEAAIFDGRGQSIGKLPALQGFTAAASSGGVVTVSGKKAWQLTLQPKDNGFIYIGDRWYRGALRLVRTANGLTAINKVNMEEYLASVIGKEMYPTWPLEALKAQAVASRSYAMYQTKKPKFKLFDVADTVSSQVYVGITGEAPSTQEAVRATAGQVLSYGGQVVEAVFHSSSGGHTENAEYVWIKPKPYLLGVPDFDQTAPFFQWTTSWTSADLRKRLPGLGTIVSMTPVKTSPTGRIQTIKIQGSTKAQIMKGSDFRRALGLRSTLFTAKPQYGPLASEKPPATLPPSGFVIEGRGNGHGLGMSQWGAYGMANAGKTYPEILAHYFQKTQIVTLP
jgi:stage II sporulation protein D